MSIRTLSVTYVENYEYTNKDLRALSRKQISLDLRIFGVKFQAKIFIRVKNLTFCNSGGFRPLGKTPKQSRIVFSDGLP